MSITIARTPDTVRNPAKVQKICLEKGCNKEYWGHPIQKYCDYHRDPKNRAKKKIKKTGIGHCNKKLLHNYNRVTEVTLICEECKDNYPVKLFPRTYIVPRFCEKCRRIHGQRRDDG